MKKIKRIAALTAVIAWGLLLLVTLITAFINTDSARTLFNGLIFTDIIFPIVIYAMMRGRIAALIALYVLLNRPGHGEKRHG